MCVYGWVDNRRRCRTAARQLKCRPQLDLGRERRREGWLVFRGLVGELAW